MFCNYTIFYLNAPVDVLKTPSNITRVMTRILVLLILVGGYGLNLVETKCPAGWTPIASMPAQGANNQGKH